MANQVHIFGHPVLLRRASAVVTDVGRVAVDAGLTSDDGVDRAYGKTVWSWHPLLVSSCRRSASGNGSDGVNQELVSGEITA